MVRMVVDSVLPHAESGPNDHRKDALPFRNKANPIANRFTRIHEISKIF